MDNYTKKWEATLEEYDAKAEQLDAEDRLRHDDWRGNMQAKFDAMGDWTEATWDEFAAKAEQQWRDTVTSPANDNTSKE